MTRTKANYLPDLARYRFRPAIAEARLITGKHACDAVYVATLAEELCNIEMKIAEIEKGLHLGSTEGGPDSPLERPCRAPASADAQWIRQKSDDLNLRLRRIEHQSRASMAAPSQTDHS